MRPRAPALPAMTAYAYGCVYYAHASSSMTTGAGHLASLTSEGTRTRHRFGPTSFITRRAERCRGRLVEKNSIQVIKRDTKRIRKRGCAEEIIQQKKSTKRPDVYKDVFPKGHCGRKRGLKAVWVPILSERREESIRLFRVLQRNVREGRDEVGVVQPREN